MVIGIILALTSPLHHEVWLAAGGVVLIIAAIAITLAPARLVDREPVTVLTPVRGRWEALNSPADKVPSHGVHSNGQTYAIDLVYWPNADVERAGIEPRPVIRRPSAFPGFGQPVFAPASGTVVHVQNRLRDHWSRKSWPALVYFLFLEGIVRDLIGPGMLLGNHVIVDMGDETYVVLAHLKRKSITVRRGERVEAGQPVAACGNSGNTTEPHLHFQLMDRPRTAVAAGIPFRFEGREIPKNGHALE